MSATRKNAQIHEERTPESLPGAFSSRESLAVEDRARLRALEQSIRYRFANPFLARAALTHCSQAHVRGIPSYERLEFLGDAVLELLISEQLYRCLPEAGPGDMTHRRSELVCRESLATLSRQLQLPTLADSNGLPGNGRHGEGLAADLLEALIGAIYLDGGMDGVRVWVEELFAPHLQRVLRIDTLNWKARLQEHCQQHLACLPRYELRSTSGSPHEQEFYVQVYIEDELLGEGRGRSKKAAEKEAARVACAALRDAPR